MPEFTLQIEGMHCGSCIRRVNQALAAVDGIQIVEVLLGSARLSTTRDPAPFEQILAALSRAGYPARLRD